MPDECKNGGDSPNPPPPPNTYVGGGPSVSPIGGGFITNPFASGATVTVSVDGTAVFSNLTGPLTFEPGNGTFTVSGATTLTLTSADGLPQTFTLPAGGVVNVGGVSTTYSAGATVTLTGQASVQLTAGQSVATTGGITTVILPGTSGVAVEGVLTGSAPASSTLTPITGVVIVSAPPTTTPDFFLVNPRAPRPYPLRNLLSRVYGITPSTTLSTTPDFSISTQWGALPGASGTSEVISGGFGIFSPSAPANEILDGLTLVQMGVSASEVVWPLDAQDTPSPEAVEEIGALDFALVNAGFIGYETAGGDALILVASVANPDPYVGYEPPEFIAFEEIPAADISMSENTLLGYEELDPTPAEPWSFLSDEVVVGDAEFGTFNPSAGTFEVTAGMTLLNAAFLSYELELPTNLTRVAREIVFLATHIPTVPPPLAEQFLDSEVVGGNARFKLFHL